MVKPTLYDLLVLIAVGFVLLIADRYLRIEQFINVEHFTNKSCGVYKLGLDPRPSCDSNLRCINGFCGSDNPPALKPTTLPVFP
jgi:hypothetical protein